MITISKSTEGVRKFRQFMEEAADLVVRYGGSLSANTETAGSRELLPKCLAPNDQAFASSNRSGPDWKMNPGKLINPIGSTKISASARYDRGSPTHFKFPTTTAAWQRRPCVASESASAVATRRKSCVPASASPEEEHSTAPRPLLWEMTKGDVIQDGWQSEPVKESLDLCLACKGCKKRLPRRVDVATYKAEFLSHLLRNQSPSTPCAGLSQFDCG